MLLHILFLPADLSGGQLLLPILTVVPFLLIYLWHMKHDHRHQDELIGRVEETNRILKELLENQKNFKG